MNATQGPGLRILYHHRIAASDGMRVHVTQIVSALRSQGHLVRVVGPGGAEAEQGAGVGGRLERMADDLRARLPSWAFELLELVYNAPAYLRLARAARAFRPDVLYERYNLFLLAGLWLSARRGLPLLLEVNGPLAEERAALGQLQLRPVGRLCQSALWRGANAVLPVTEVLAGMVREAGVPAERIHVIANGADLEARSAGAQAAAARAGLALPDNALVLGFVGFVRPWHGLGSVVEALPELPARVHLVVVGDGPALPQLRARADELSVSHRVHLLGRIDHAEVPAWMQTFDVALQPASVPYASPLKLFEYMALGRAVLAPDQPNIREVLRHDVNALLFDPRSEDCLRQTLARLCHDDALRTRLGKAALATLQSRELTWAGNANRIVPPRPGPVAEGPTAAEPVGRRQAGTASVVSAPAGAGARRERLHRGARASEGARSAASSRIAKRPLPPRRSPEAQNTTTTKAIRSRKNRKVAIGAPGRP